MQKGGWSMCFKSRHGKLGLRVFALGFTLSAMTARAEAPLPALDRIMIVIAHQDDDVMVLVPDLVSAVRAHKPIQTVYLTSGDAGFTCNAYTQGRERGAKAVHAQLAGVENRWLDEERVIRGKRVRFSRLAGTSESMAFIGLPNPAFLSVTPPEGALEKLWLRQISRLDTLPYDGRSAIDAYTREELIEVLRALMDDFSPEDVRMLDASQLQIPSYPFEHVDHMGSAMFALAAFQRHARADALTFYPLYSVLFKPENLSAETAKLRADLFETYRKYDPKPCDTVTTTVCGSLTNCDPMLLYQPLWPRGYPEDTVRSANSLLRTPSGLCLEAAGSALRTSFCNPFLTAQRWALARGGSVRNLATGQCLFAASANAGQAVSLRACVREPSQQFYLTTQGQLRGPDATCVRESLGPELLSECTPDSWQLGFQLL
jgi:LmbE family N-acetylglucosaminyl deacetylase